MSQANQVLPTSTQTTALAGTAFSQPIEDNTNLEKSDHFSDVLNSEIAQKDSAKSSSGHNPQPDNPASTEGQKLPQDGKSVPVSAGFYILNKSGFVAGLDLQTDSQFGQPGQTGADNRVLPDILTGAEAVNENPLGNPGVAEQNAVVENGDELEILTGLESKQTETIADTNTQALSAEDISSRSVLPEASVVGQQKAVENIQRF